MVIGNGGERLKRIGTEARQELETLMDAKVFLELWVKVRSGWADDEAAPAQPTATNKERRLFHGHQQVRRTPASHRANGERPTCCTAMTGANPA